MLAVAGDGGDQWGVESGRRAAAGLHVPRLPEEPFEQGGLGLGCLFARALPDRVSAARILQTAAADVETCRELVANGGVAALLTLLLHTLLHHTPPAPHRHSSATAVAAAVAGAATAAPKGVQPREQELKRELCELLTQMLQTSRTETLASCRPCESA